MARGSKTGGRWKGTLNKSSQEVAELLVSLNCSPIEGMAQIAMNSKNSPELRGKMFSELARYIFPQRKAIEHSGSTADGTIQVVVRSVLDPRP